MTKNFQDALQNSLLSSLITQAKQHLIVDQLFKTYLEEDLQMHCRIAQLKDNVLIIHISNGIWLLRINRAIPNLLNSLKTHSLLAKLEKIQCKIRPFDFTERNA